MDANMVAAHVLSARSGQYVCHGTDAWIFGVVLEREVEGHNRWMIETTDASVVSQLRSAYAEKTLVNVSRELLVDPAINAVD